jgi:hypothetical protein
MISEDWLLEIVTCKLETLEKAMHTEKTRKLVCRERTKDETNVEEREEKNPEVLKRDDIPGVSQFCRSRSRRLGSTLCP